MSNLEKLTFATQGNEHSFHAEAARHFAGTSDITVMNFAHFGDVVRASRSRVPGLGVIAINTVAGAVEDSAKEIIGKRTSALPPVVGRVDIPVVLSVIGKRKQTINELDRWGVTCHAQKAAWLQCESTVKDSLPRIRHEFSGESTKAVAKVLAKNNPNHVAIGPQFSAELMGGVVLLEQANPPGSVTSFYALQRDPRQQHLPDDPNKTRDITIVALSHPKVDGEFEKCITLADKMGIRAIRFIPFDLGDQTRHNPKIKKGGGILEIDHGYYDEIVPEFCARVNALKGIDGVEGPFDAKRLGEYKWQSEEHLDYSEILAVPMCKVL